MGKDGCSGGRQRYCCGDCQRRYLPEGAYRRPSPRVKERALRMYGEGSGLSAIGRVLGYSATAVPGWVKKWAPCLGSAAAMERGADEGPAAGGGGVLGRDVDLPGARHGAKREDCWIWTAVVRGA